MKMTRFDVNQETHSDANASDDVKDQNESETQMIKQKLHEDDVVSSDVKQDDIIVTLTLLM